METSKNPSPPGPKKGIDGVGKFLFGLIGLTMIIAGLAAVITGETPERSTRFGPAGPLFGMDAIHIGVAFSLLGVALFAVFFRSRRVATIWVSGFFLLALLSIFSRIFWR